MPKFVKKPVVIDAFIWTGGPDQMEDPPWICEAMENNDVWVTKRPSALIQLAIRTASGVVFASRGDYIIHGVDGEIYPCPPGVFAATYDLVENDAPPIRPMTFPHEWRLKGGAHVREYCIHCYVFMSDVKATGDMNHCAVCKVKNTGADQ